MWQTTQHTKQTQTKHKTQQLTQNKLMWVKWNENSLLVISTMIFSRHQQSPTSRHKALTSIRKLHVFSMVKIVEQEWVSESALTSPLSQGHNSNGRNRNVMILVVLKNRLKWLHVSHWKYPKRLLEGETRTGRSEGWESQLRPEYHSLIAEYHAIQWSDHDEILTGDSRHIEEQLSWMDQLILTVRMREKASVLCLLCPGRFWTYCKMADLSSPFRNSILSTSCAPTNFLFQTENRY